MLLDHIVYLFFIDNWQKIAQNRPKVAQNRRNRQKYIVIITLASGPVSERRAAPGGGEGQAEDEAVQLDDRVHRLGRRTRAS
jgi:hypothetical protein